MGMDQEIEAEAARMADRVAHDMAKLIMDRSSAVGTSTINVSAGGIGVVIAMCGCLLSMAVALGCGFAFISSKQDINRQDQKIERMQDYLQNIYQQAPWLKQKESK